MPRYESQSQIPELLSRYIVIPQVGIVVLITNKAEIIFGSCCWMSHLSSLDVAILKILKTVSKNVNKCDSSF
jgi:hypothetical protein